MTAWVWLSAASVYMCPCSKRKIAGAINTKSVKIQSTAGPRHALTLEVKRSKNGLELRLRTGERRGSACQHDCRFSSRMCVLICCLERHETCQKSSSQLNQQT